MHAYANSPGSDSVHSCELHLLDADVKVGLQDLAVQVGSGALEHNVHLAGAVGLYRHKVEAEEEFGCSSGKLAVGR